jgi:hypothetical protein
VIIKAAQAIWSSKEKCKIHAVDKKSEGQVTEFECSPCVVVAPSVYRWVLSYRVQDMEHGKPAEISVCWILSINGVEPSQGGTMFYRVKEDGKSESHFVMKWIAIAPHQVGVNTEGVILWQARACRLPLDARSEQI